MVDLIKPLLLQERRGLFTTDAAGAEHGHLLVFRRVQVLFDILRELTKRIRGRVPGVLESPNLHFVLIACVHHQYVRIGDEIIPFFRVYIGADDPFRVDALHTHGDDLFLELHFGSLEGLDVDERFFVVDAFEPLISLQPAANGIHTFTTAGYGAVNALTGQQQCAVYLFLQHQIQQWLTKGFVIIQDCELIKRTDNNILAHESGFSCGPDRKSGAWLIIANGREGAILTNTGEGEYYGGLQGRH